MGGHEIQGEIEIYRPIELAWRMGQMGLGHDGRVSRLIPCSMKGIFIDYHREQKDITYAS